MVIKNRIYRVADVYFLIVLVATLLIAIPSATTAEPETLPQHLNAMEIEKLNTTNCESGFSFIVTSDSHQSETVFERIIDQVNETMPSFAITTGDFTNNGRPEEYAQFIKQIERSKVPWFTVPGNHEYRSPEGHTTVDGPKRFAKIFGKQDYFFDLCGWRFIALDVVKLDTLLPGQLNKLEKALKPTDGKAVVFMHYPPMIIPKWEEGIFKTTATRYMEILAENRVRYSFAGHIHVYDNIKIGETTYIVTGGAGGGLDKDYTPEKLNSDDAGPFYHYTLVEIHSDGSSAFKPIQIDYQSAMQE